MTFSKQQLGSKTAKGGFQNELNIVDKFNNYQDDDEANQWLGLMGYNVQDIESLQAVQIPTRLSKKSAIYYKVSAEAFEVTQKFKKADIQIQLTIKIDEIIYCENISLKKANETANFNQIDKRSVDTYQKMWGFNDEIAKTLKQFTGAIVPNDAEAKVLKDKRRWYLTELPENQINDLLQFFNDNRLLIFSDILKGRGMLSAEWFLVTRKNKNNSIDWTFKNINEVINFYSKGNISVSKRGGLILGKLTAQRKGGTPDPTSLQFKIKPNDLFKID